MFAFPFTVLRADNGGDQFLEGHQFPYLFPSFYPSSTLILEDGLYGLWVYYLGQGCSNIDRVGSSIMVRRGEQPEKVTFSGLQLPKSIGQRSLWDLLELVV